MSAEILRVAAFALVCVFVAMSVKKDAPAFAVVITVAASVIVIFMVLPALKTVLSALDESAAKIGANGVNIKILLKIVGIAYIAEFASQICTDAGENSIAARVELAGKILIMATAAPIVVNLLNEILRYI